MAKNVATLLACIRRLGWKLRPFEQMQPNGLIFRLSVGSQTSCRTKLSVDRVMVARNFRPGIWQKSGNFSWLLQTRGETKLGDFLRTLVPTSIYF